MELNKCLFWGIVGALFFTACTNHFTSESEFLKWLNQPQNGLVKKMTANGFKLTLKYIPSEYLQYVEREKEGKAYSQILPEEFNDSMTFIFSIEHQDNGVDVTNYSVQNMAEYKDRIAQLNFDMKKHLFIKTGDGRMIPPVLSVFENVYEIGGKKTFYVVFPKKTVEKEAISMVDIVFEDPFLHTGISHFIFNKNTLNQIPILEFTK